MSNAKDTGDLDRPKVDEGSKSAWDRAKEALEREENGIVVDFSPAGGVTWRFKVGSMTDWSKPYQRAIAELREDPLVKRHYEKIGEKDYARTPDDDEFEDEVVRRAVFRGVIRAWRASGEDGLPLERTEENALKLFRHFPALYQLIVTKAADASAFGHATGKDAADKADAEGNS